MNGQIANFCKLRMAYLEVMSQFTRFLWGGGSLVLCPHPVFYSFFICPFELEYENTRNEYGFSFMWGELLRVHHYPSNHHLCISLSFCFQRKYSRCNLVVTFFRGLTWFFFSPITSSLSFLKTLFSAFSHTLLVRFIPLPPLQTAFYSLSLNSLRGIPQDNSSPVFSQFLYSAPSSSRFTLLLAEYVLLLRG